MSEPTHTVQAETLSTTTSLAERLAAMPDGPDRQAMLSALAIHPSARAIACRHRPTGGGMLVEVDVPERDAPVMFMIQPDGRLAESRRDSPDLTPARHLSAITAAVTALENDDRASAATRGLLLALAAYATAELRAQVGDGDRWEALAAS